MRYEVMSVVDVKLCDCEWDMRFRNCDFNHEFVVWNEECVDMCGDSNCSGVG